MWFVVVQVRCARAQFGSSDRQTYQYLFYLPPQSLDHPSLVAHGCNHSGMSANNTNNSCFVKLLHKKTWEKF